jgi:hypothetical protein
MIALSLVILSLLTIIWAITATTSTAVFPAVQTNRFKGRHQEMYKDLRAAEVFLSEYTSRLEPWAWNRQSLYMYNLVSDWCDECRIAGANEYLLKRGEAIKERLIALNKSTGHIEGDASQGTFID